MDRRFQEPPSIFYVVDAYLRLFGLIVRLFKSLFKVKK